MAARLHGCWTESWCHEPAVCEEEAQPRGVSRRENMAATVPPASQVEAGDRVPRAVSGAEGRSESPSLPETNRQSLVHSKSKGALVQVDSGFTLTQAHPMSADHALILSIF